MINPFSYLFAPSPCWHHYLFIPKMLQSAIRVCDPSVAFSSDAAGDAVASTGVAPDADITRCYLGLRMLLMCACVDVSVSLVCACVCLWVCVFAKGGSCLSVQCSALPCIVLCRVIPCCAVRPDFSPTVNCVSSYTSRTQTRAWHALMHQCVRVTRRKTCWACFRSWESCCYQPGW